MDREIIKCYNFVIKWRALLRGGYMSIKRMDQIWESLSIRFKFLASFFCVITLVSIFNLYLNNNNYALTDQELGTEPEVVDQVGFGAIDFTRVSIANLVKTVPELYVLQLPYLYEDRNHMWRVLESDIGDELLQKVGDYGIRK